MKKTFSKSRILMTAAGVVLFSTAALAQGYDGLIAAPDSGSTHQQAEPQASSPYVSPSADDQVFPGMTREESRKVREKMNEELQTTEENFKQAEMLESLRAEKEARELAEAAAAAALEDGNQKTPAQIAEEQRKAAFNKKMAGIQEKADLKASEIKKRTNEARKAAGLDPIE